MVKAAARTSKHIPPYQQNPSTRCC
ncbi:hypothetical protein R3I93_006660 [Phoxinus phoxinus]|uniref:Uncharacterized protein n=1 Tax=Phoxinus phoxinus TaxID=58324 RepID=A0AAN9D786_9TELE